MYGCSRAGDLALCQRNWVIAETGDFNADGFSDILWRDSNSGADAIWFIGANGLTVSQGAGIGTVATNWVIQGLPMLTKAVAAQSVASDESRGHDHPKGSVPPTKHRLPARPRPLKIFPHPKVEWSLIWSPAHWTPRKFVRMGRL